MEKRRIGIQEMKEIHTDVKWTRPDTGEPVEVSR